MKKQNSISKNYFYNLAYQFLTILIPFITTPYLSRILGADGIGTVSYVESIASYFVIFATMGITTYGQREISYVQDSIELRSIVFWNVKILSVCISSFVLVCYIFFPFFQSNSEIYLIYSLNIIAVAADITWYFQGLEEFRKIVFRNTIIKIANTAFVFLMIHSKEDLIVYAFGHTFFSLLSNVSLWSYLPQYIQKVQLKKIQPFKNIRTILSLFVPTIATQVYTVLDKTMIGIITRNSYENGYYEQAIKITRIALSVITSLSTVMIPRIGYSFEKNDIEEVERLMNHSYRFVWFIGVPLCLGLAVVSDNLIPWFLGPGYEQVSNLLKILSVLILAVGISNITGVQYFVPTKKQNLLSITVILGAATNFLANLYLITQYGAIGAAVASVIAEVVITIFQLYLARKELRPFEIVKNGIPYYIAGAIMAVCLHFIGHILAPSIINTIILIGSGAVIYFAILGILRDDFFFSVLTSLFSKIKRK